MSAFLEFSLRDAAAAEAGASDYFFELANQDKVVYKCRSDGSALEVSQDRDIEESTGGIIWETSFLLADWLIMQQKSSALASGPLAASANPSILEVGSGCGLLGLALAKDMTAGRVVLTETDEALSNLQLNVAANLETHAESFRFRTSSEKDGRRSRVAAARLRWDVASDRSAVTTDHGSKFDLIVGTDVIFNVQLVRPLLDSMLAFCHARTEVYLCVQERCAAAHAELLRVAPDLFSFEDKTDELRGCKGSVGRVATELECYLFKLVVRARRADEEEEDDDEEEEEEEEEEEGEGDSKKQEKKSKKKKTKKKKKERQQKSDGEANDGKKDSKR